MRRVTSSAKPLGEALDELVGKLGIKKKLLEYEAVLRWEEIVGEKIARATTPTKISRGVLFISVKTSAWRNELTMRKKEIMLKINSTLGQEVVLDIKFQ
jgi:predicted nucleic acid-binding Zn ribbon protein